jgi:hypothetical protein
MSDSYMGSWLLQGLLFRIVSFLLLQLHCVPSTLCKLMVAHGPSFAVVLYIVWSNVANEATLWAGKKGARLWYAVVGFNLGCSVHMLSDKLYMLQNKVLLRQAAGQVQVCRDM